MDLQDSRPPGKATRREFLSFGARALLLGLLAACAPREAATPTTEPPSTAPPSGAPGSPSPRPTPNSPAPTNPPTPAAASVSTATPAPSQTGAATSTASTDVPLEVKIGQMVLVGFRGLKLNADNPIMADLRERHIGGVVLFDVDIPGNSPVRNIQSPAQLRALCTALQQNATRPLLISTDQEGGNVARLSERLGFAATYSEQYLGTRNDPVLTRQNAETIAGMLASVGINLNLAPVVDLNTNPDNPIIGRLGRSFSADPTIVTNDALIEIRAHHAKDVLTTLKHFPGHGSSKQDSHLGFVDVTDSWSPIELEPYRRIIASGQGDAVMTAHIFNSKLDPKLPATLSRPVITGILRQRLQWDGVVISDDMQMGAISQYYGLDSAVEDAINAGVDILSISNNRPEGFDPAIAGKIIGIIRQLVVGGRISEARIDQSYRRIMTLKGRLK